MNKWQIIIEELLGVFGTKTKLVERINEEYGEDFTYDQQIGRIASGEQKKVFYELGQALVIFHARYVPAKQNNKNGVVSSGENTHDKT